MTKFSVKRLLILIFILSILLKVINPNFPFFTADEARISYRGYELLHHGQDELDRHLPLLFNSLLDYQLPLTSYVTALGTVFGKNDFLVRVPYIFLGSSLIFLLAAISKRLNLSDKSSIIAAAGLTLSPTLILISKVPNQALLLTLLMLLLFYLLIKRSVNFFSIFAVEIFIVLTSKNAWLILTPFVAFTLAVLQNNMSVKLKRIISVATLFLCLSTFFLFYTFVPQSYRSLSENNFNITSDITINNGINRLRGEGIEYGWPALIEKLLFNKAYFVLVGVLQWLSNLQPAVYFGQFDPTGEFGFISSGVFPKALIIPCLFGLVNILKGRDQRKKSLLFYPLILTLPALFIYPAKVYECIILTIPFITVIIAEGFAKLSKIITYLIIAVAITEVLLNLLFLDFETKAAEIIRPYYISSSIQEVNHLLANKESVGISDNMTTDIIPFILWYSDKNLQVESQQKIPFPYRFVQASISQVRIVTSESRIEICSDGSALLLGERDIKRLSTPPVISKNLIGYNESNTVYKLEHSYCIR